MSERYKSVCITQTSGDPDLVRVFADFGDVHASDFKTWWRDKGEYLFAERDLQSVRSLRVEELSQHATSVVSGNVLIIAIPLALDKKTIASKVQSLVAKHHLGKRGRSKRTKASTARYPIGSFRDVASLKRALEVVKLRREGKLLKAIARRNETESEVSRFQAKGETLIEGVEQGVFPLLPAK